MAKSTISTFADSYFDTIIEQHSVFFQRNLMKNSLPRKIDQIFSIEEFEPES
jgi:hypothetical protein